jgi:SSS family solute:Na+ symporter
MSQPVRTWIDLSILPLYLAGTILIGWLARRKGASANAYLSATRSLPLPIVVASYISVNCGALDIMGLSAMGAQYGVDAFHFYWLGAIPAMIFLALWMMPVYRASGIRSVPQYLEQRYGPGVRVLNACSLATIMLLLAGISLYAMGQLLAVAFGWSFAVSVALAAAVVVLYTQLGGIRATIYNEVFQLGVMLAGLIPLALRSVRLTHLLSMPHAASRDHLWAQLPAASLHSRLDGVGVILGLGFILSLGYWCTDFVMMQRAFTARTDSDARQVPLWAGFGKMFFSLLVVLPGLAAYHLLPQLGHQERFDQTMPALMKLLYGPGLLGLGLTTLAASLLSCLASNVSAFAAVWTEDIYRAHLHRNASETHYLRMGRAALLTAIVLAALASWVNFCFSNLMEHVQLIFSVLGAPFWAIFLLGMSWRKATARAAVAGFLSGAALALLHLLAVTQGWLHYGSMMNANFHVAIYAFITTVLVAVAHSIIAPQDGPQAPQTLVFRWQAAFRGPGVRRLWILALLLLTACLLLNLWWW